MVFNITEFSTNNAFSKNFVISEINIKERYNLGFDKSKVEIPNIENKLNSDERKRGWGLQLITELMDTVEYDSDETGTTVTMTKKREDNE